MKELITIDGSMGEGGGQVLRTSLSLAAITGHELALAKIRAGRDKPGLKRQHLTCVRAVAEICGAKVKGDEVGSLALEFAPGKIKAGDYRFDVGTAGSVTLVAQTVIPVLLKADAPSSVTITGGTHVPFAPIWEFFAEAYLPELRRMGARVEAELESCGFYPAAGGVIKLRVWPYDESSRPEKYELTDLGAYRGGTVVGVVSAIPKPIAEAEVGIVGSHFPELALSREVRTCRVVRTRQLLLREARLRARIGGNLRRRHVQQVAQGRRERSRASGARVPEVRQGLRKAPRRPAARAAPSARWRTYGKGN